MDCRAKPCVLTFRTFEGGKNDRSVKMKFLVVIACAAMALVAVSAQAQMERPVQTFKSSAGPIKVTPVYHASLAIKAGGKVIVVDPAKPAVFTGLPQADLILITDIHGDHMDADLVKTVSKA